MRKGDTVYRGDYGGMGYVSPNKIVSDINATGNYEAKIQSVFGTYFDKNYNPKPCYTRIIDLLKNYNVADYNSKKSIYTPNNVLNYRYADIMTV